MAAAGELPAPIRLGTKTVRWRLSDIERHIQSVGR
jgi:predicted DNA-binding transcriptional regulator AlpA